MPYPSRRARPRHAGAGDGLALGEREELADHVPVVLASAGEPVAGAERKTGPEGGEAMIHGDATAAALAAVLDEEEAAEDRAARAGHALAELEERAGEDPAAVAGLGARRRRLAAGGGGPGGGGGG